MNRDQASDKQDAALRRVNARGSPFVGLPHQIRPRVMPGNPSKPFEELSVIFREGTGHHELEDEQ